MFDNLTDSLEQMRRDGVDVNLSFSYEQLALLSASIFLALVFALVIAKKI